MKEKDKNVIDGDINSALIKKALGFDAKEVVEEYALNDEGEVKLSKKKITTKCVPPDVSALKMLLERDCPLSALSDEELETEKTRLLEILRQSEKKNKEKKIAKRKETRKTQKSG
ncbi:MAG: hypothetical protein IJQ07_04370 [Clostridia bacterium]|nr:hypothetical protein [Clostridia bacterium]